MFARTTLERCFLAGVFALCLPTPATAQVSKVGLKLWLRADAGVKVEGGLVSSWTDQSGGGHVFSNTGTSRPSLLTENGGRKLLRFSGAQQLNGKMSATLKSATIFALFRYRVPDSDNDYLYAFGNKGRSGSQMCLSRQSLHRVYHYDGSRQNVGPGNIPTGSWSVTTQLFGRTGPRSHELWRGGARQQRSTALTDYSIDANTARIGNWTSGSYRFVGDLMQLLVYDRIVSGRDRARIEAWLASQARGAAVLTLGKGCWGSGGHPSLRAASLPKLGTTFRTELTALPKDVTTFVFGFIGFSDTRYGSLPLPFPLTTLGFKGCVLRVSLDKPEARLPRGGRATWNLPLPNLAALDGQVVHLQAIIYDTPANRAGWTLSNGLTATLGK